MSKPYGSRVARFLAIASLCFSLGACSWFSTGDTQAVTAIPHTPVSLSYYQAGRAYSAQGRFELAREQYLLAYAAAEGDSSLRTMLEQELKAADKMLRTVR